MSAAVRVILVMGVSGSGKSTLGRALAARLSCPFLDADDYHPAANVQKMSAGQPLEDSDRAGWLQTLRQKLGGEPRGTPIVLACSALKSRYRRTLLEGLTHQILFLDLDRNQALARVSGRAEHFMPSSLVASQFETLEVPSEHAAEFNVKRLDATCSLDELVAQALTTLAHS